MKDSVALNRVVKKNALNAVQTSKEPLFNSSRYTAGNMYNQRQRRVNGERVVNPQNRRQHNIASAANARKCAYVVSARNDAERKPYANPCAAAAGC